MTASVTIRGVTYSARVLPESVRVSFTDRLITLRLGQAAVSAPRWIVAGDDVPVVTATLQDDPRFSTLPAELARAVYPDDFPRRGDEILYGCPGALASAVVDAAYEALLLARDEP